MVVFKPLSLPDFDLRRGFDMRICMGRPNGNIGMRYLYCTLQVVGLFSMKWRRIFWELCIEECSD